jgi:hypothetical protein
MTVLFIAIELADQTPPTAILAALSNIVELTNVIVPPLVATPPPRSAELPVTSELVTVTLL